MRVLIDANVLLDVALARPGFHEASEAALSQCGRDENQAFVAWHTLSNVFYILRSQSDHDRAIEFLKDLLEWVQIVSVEHADAVRAFGYGMRDFEDALQVSAAEAGLVDLILTRNTADFRDSPIPARTPEEFLADFAAKEVADDEKLEHDGPANDS